MSTITRAVRFGAIAAAAALLITGCTSHSPTSTSTSATTAKGGTLTIPMAADTYELDPAKSQSLAITALGLVERRLTTWKIVPGKDPVVVPDLATTTGTASDGGKTWTYTLKSGLKYADGEPITTQDIKYGVERSFSPQLSGGLSYHKALLVGGSSYTGPYSGKELSSIETPNSTTIVFHLNSAYGDWPWIASMPAFTPVPKAKDTTPATYGQHPEASGPYQVASFDQGSAITLTRNPNWSAKTDSIRTAGPDKIVFSLGQNTSTVTQSLIADAGSAKDSFGSQYLGAADLAQVRANPDAAKRLATSDAGPLQYLAINVTHGALKNLKVRQALEYAVDRKSYLIATGGTNAGVDASTLITPGIAGRQDYNLYKSGADGDVSKAKSLLKDAGFSSGVSLTLLTQNDTSSLAQAQAIQQGIERAGVKVTLKPEDPTSFYSDVSSSAGDYDLALSSWQPDFPSANSNIQPLFASSQIGNGGYNVSHYSSAAVDKLIDTATATVDQKQAQALWAQADKRIMQDAPVVPLIYAKQSFLRGSGVQNFAIASFPAYPNYLTLSLQQ